MKTLLLEPHFDDTAYSMAGLILSGVISADSLIVTVFSRTLFAPYADASGIDQISALRYREHQKFCEKISFMHCVLGYEEAPQRGWSMDRIFDHVYCNEQGYGEMQGFSDHQEIVLKQLISDDFTVLSKSFIPEAVFTPLGICGHIDHILVRECAERVFPEKVSYYEDLPYAGEISSKEYTSWIDQLTNGLYSTKNPAVSTLDQRIELLKYYPSQVAEKDIESVRNYVYMHQGERFWSKTNIHG